MATYPVAKLKKMKAIFGFFWKLVGCEEFVSNALTDIWVLEILRELRCVLRILCEIPWSVGRCVKVLVEVCPPLSAMQKLGSHWELMMCYRVKMLPAKCENGFAFPFLLQIFLEEDDGDYLEKAWCASSGNLCQYCALCRKISWLQSRSSWLRSNPLASKLTVKPRQGGNKNIIKKVTLDPAKLCLDFLPFTTHPLHRVKVETLRVSLSFYIIMSGIQHFYKSFSGRIISTSGRNNPWQGTSWELPKAMYEPQFLPTSCNWICHTSTGRWGVFLDFQKIFTEEIAEFGQPGESPFMTCNASNFVSEILRTGRFRRPIGVNGHFKGWVSSPCTH